MPNDTPIKLSASSKALHWSAIHDIRVASDIAGAGASGEFAEYGATPEEIYGAAIGVPNAGAHSGYGIFTDANNNTIVVATESRAAWGMIKAKNLLGSNPYIIHLPRNMGEGGAFEANAFMIAGINQRFGDYAGWIAAESSETSGDARTKSPTGETIAKNPNFPTGLQLQPFLNFPQLLEQIEATGRKFDRPIVVLNSGHPITLSSVLNQFLSTILLVAKPFATLIGIPPSLYDILSTALQEVVTTGKFSLDSLASVSQLIIPSQYRSLIPQAQKIYGKIDSGNYIGAMQELGVSSSNAVGAVKSLVGGDLSKLLTSTKLPYSELLGKAQNLFQMDTVRALTAATRSGSVMSALTDAGSMTKVPMLQNLLTTTTAETLIGAMPNVSDVFSAVINETRDIANVDLHKGALQASLGQIVGADTFDDMTIIGLKERANLVLENGSKDFVLPSIIPNFKQFDFAKMIADEVGIPVKYIGANGAVIAQNPNESTKEWR